MASRSHHNGVQEAPRMRSRSQTPTSRPARRAPGASDSSSARNTPTRARAPLIPATDKKPPEKKQPAPPPSPELSAAKEELAAAKEELSAVKERLASTEKEMAVVSGELEKAKAAADAVTAQRSAAEAELTAAAAAAKRKEEEWLEKMESVENRREIEVAALRSLSDELEAARAALSAATDAKNAEAAAAAALRSEVEKKKEVEERTVVLQNMIKVLRADVAAAKKAEFDAGARAAEWKQMAEAELGECRREMEALRARCEDLLEEKAEAVDGERKAVTAAEKLSAENVELLSQVEASNAELEKSRKAAEELGSALREAQERFLAEQAAAGSLSAENAELLSKLEASTGELEGSRKAAEELGSTLREAQERFLAEQAEKAEQLSQLEASNGELERSRRRIEELGLALREAQERFLAEQAAAGSAAAEIMELKAALKNTQERYEVMIDEANYERVCLQKSFERLESEAMESQGEISALRSEMELLAQQLKKVEKTESKDTTDDNELMRELKDSCEEANARRSEAEEKLSAKESELQGLMKENGELREREAAASEKITELTALLAGHSNGATEEHCKDNDEAEAEEGENGSADEYEPVVVVPTMWENNGMVDDAEEEDHLVEDGDDTAKENDTESDIGSHADENAGADHKAQGSTEKPAINGETSPLPGENLKKKWKFGGLLKKKNQLQH